MIKIKVKENESIERALKRYKKRVQQTGLIKEVRSRTFYEKPSISRRDEKIKAAYKQRMQDQEQE